MTTITFDTLKLTQRLEKAGFHCYGGSPKESLSEIMEAHLATKLDVQNVRE